MKAKRFTILSTLMMSNFLFALNAFAGNECEGFDANIPLAAQTPGMQYISQNSFKSFGKAMLAAKKDKVILEGPDLCFAGLTLPHEEIKEIIVKNTGPDCVKTPQAHACTGGGIQEGEAGAGKIYLQNISKVDPDIMAILSNAKSTAGLKLGWGDLQYSFYDMTPAGMYKQQITNTSAMLDKLIGCTELDVSKCSISESAESVYLRENNPKSAKDAIIEASQKKIYLGMGSIQKHYTPSPGTTTSIHDDLVASSGGSGGSGDMEELPIGEQPSSEQAPPPISSSK